MIDYEEISSIALLTAIQSFLSIGVYLAVFYGLNELSFFTVDLQLFLDKFALPFILAVFVIKTLNQLMARLEMQVM